MANEIRPTLSLRLASIFTDDDPVATETLREEVYEALKLRQSYLRRLRSSLKKVSNEETPVDRALLLYDGPTGLLSAFMDTRGEIEQTAKNGKNPAQIDLEEQIALEQREEAKRFLDAAVQDLEADKTSTGHGTAPTVVVMGNPDSNSWSKNFGRMADTLEPNEQLYRDALDPENRKDDA